MTAKIYFDIAHLRFAHPDTLVNINNILSIANSDSVRRQYCFGKLIFEYGNSMGRWASNSAFGFVDFNFSEDQRIITNETFYTEYLKEFNIRTQNLEALLTFLWLVKDNSIGLYGTFGQIPQLKVVNGKSRSIVNYNCKGQIGDSVFSESELKDAGELVTKYSSISGLSRKIIDDSNILWEYDDRGEFVKAIHPKTSQHFHYNDQNSIDRAIHFLIIARNQNYLMYKIAYYMPIFECLFNDFGSEITFRIAQRAAYYVGETAEERKHIFDIVSDGYNYRSKFIHGSKIESEKNLDTDILSDLAEQLDIYLRKILRKAILNDSDVFTTFKTGLKNVFFDNPILGLKINKEHLIAEAMRRIAQKDDSEKRRKDKEQRKSRE